ncbi:MAG: ADP-ribosylglycohydrolase family protein [Pseudomonadota bacterium]
MFDRARGALLGLAVGDALGTTLEFSRRDSHPLHTEMVGGGVFNLKPGQWTDDAAMALALADSLISCRGFDVEDLMQRFVRWYRHGEYSCTGRCFDIGSATRVALVDYELTGEPYAGSTDPYTAGNGSLMRLAPVALFALDDDQLALQIAADQSRTTHGAKPCIEACQFFVSLLRAAILGEKDIIPVARQLGRNYPGIRHVTDQNWNQLDRDDIVSGGFVVSTIEAALWSVARTHNFEEALILAVNLGADADTVGAVTGQLAGALYGASSIPLRWRRHLAWQSKIDDTARQLLTAWVAPTVR